MEAIVKNAPDSPGPQARPSPLLKLFGPNSIVDGAEVDLGKVRDRIYSYAWSRDRRDDEKLDFVVSQWGVNRNVPERFVPDTPYGTADFLHPEKLRCNLHLVNKDISADFLRYVHSVNELEIDIDLKPDHTQQAEDELHKIVAALQNPNFQKNTEVARVRIHFPSKYPANHLHPFNQQALEDIARALDQFRELHHVVIRVVPSREEASDYELRFAAFPFYPMRMTRWALRILNLTTYNWDHVDSQRVSALDKAWELYQKTGCLSAAEHDCVAVSTPLPNKTAVSPAISMAFPNLNGSQKRKQRKLKAAGPVFDKTVSPRHDGKTPSEPAQAPARSDTPDQGTQDLSTSSDAGTAGGSIKLPPGEDATAGGDNVRTSTEIPADKLGGVAAGPPSPPTSPRQSHTSQQFHVNSPSTETSTGEVILTPSESTDDNANSESAPNFSGAKGGVNGPAASRPTSPPALSGSMEPTDAHDTQNVEEAEKSGSKRSRKTKRKSKSKKAKAVNSPEPEQTLALSRTTDSGLAASGEMEDKQLASIEGSTVIVDNDSNVTLVCDPNDTLTVRRLCGPNMEETRTTTTTLQEQLQRMQLQVQVRSRQAMDLHRRQQQRTRDGQQLAEAQKRETRDKRASKKAKELHLRRGKVATDSPLSRLMEARRASKPKDDPKHGVKSEPVASLLPAESNHTIDTACTEHSEHEDWSSTKTDASSLGDRPFRFGFDDDPIERNIEEIVDDEMEELRDESTEDGDSERIPFSPGNYVHQHRPLEDDDTDNTIPVPRRFGQRATAHTGRKLKHPPGFPVPQAGQACHTGDTASGGPSLSKDEAHERRNKWVAAVATNDDERYAQRKEEQARLEKQMEAGGTGHSGYDHPIHDNWTQTDEDGKCVKTGGEDIIYSQQA